MAPLSTSLLRLCAYHDIAAQHQHHLHCGCLKCLAAVEDSFFMHMRQF